MILSRIVSPESFGLFAMVFAIVGVATILGDFGLSLAAIRAPVLSQAEKSNLFWLNAGFGLVLGMAVACSAWGISALYGQPQLIGVTLALALNFPLNGLGVQFRVELNRTERFGRLASIDVLAQAMALCASVVLALGGWELEALVAQSVVYSLAGLSLAVAMAHWLPSLWSRTARTKRFVIFGANTTLLQLLNYVSTNIGAVFIGQSHGAAALGQYNRAAQLSSAPVQQFASPLTRLVLPRIAAEVGDRARLQAVVHRHLLLTSIPLVGMLSFLFIAAPGLVAAVLGPGWAPAADFVRVLAVGCAFQAMGYVFYWVTLACDRTDLLVWSELPGRVLVIISIPVGAAAGLDALGLAAIGSFGLFIIWLTGVSLVAPRLDLNARRLTASSLRVLASSSFGPLLCLLLSGWIEALPVAVQLIVAVPIWAVPIAVSLCVPVVRRDWLVVFDMVRRRRG